MMNRVTALLVLALITICGMMVLTNRVAGQRNDNSISANAVVFDPCLVQPLPPQCLPQSTPDPRKAISMGAVIRDEDLKEQVQDLRGPNPGLYPNAKPNIEIIRESRTGWVRLWVDWPTLQPTHDFSFENIYNDDRTRQFIESLDAQIVFARQNNLKVILVVHHRFPLWSNGTVDQECGGRCDDETDPIKKKDCERACGMRNDPNAARFKLKEPRNPFGRVPSDLGMDSSWGKWISFLVSHYGYSGETKGTLRYVDYLEVVNEPNHTMWPQWKDDKVGNRDNIKGRLVIANNVAQMFKTAQDIVTRRNAEPVVRNEAVPTTIKLAGPGTSDIRDPMPNAPDDPQDKKDRRKAQRIMQTGYDTFTRELLVQLGKLRFNPRSYNSWTHHTYADVEKSRWESPVFDSKAQTLEDPTARTNSAAWVRELLRVGTGRGRANRWTGWPDSEHPGLMITESGARLSSVGTEARQAELVRDNFNLMLSDNGRLRAGIGLFTQYLTYSDICFDSGLFYFIDPEPIKTRDLDCKDRNGFTGGGGAQRVVYDRWKTLTSRPQNPVP